MTSADPLLHELATTAGALAPLVAPAGQDQLLVSLTATAAALFGAGACSLALLSPEEDELHYVAASGRGAETVIGMRIPATQGIAGWVVQSGQPVALSDLRHDARFARDIAEDTGYVPEAILAVPVTGPHGPLGVLTLLDRDPTRDGAQFDLQTASLFADQAALAIDAARSAADLGRVLLDGLASAAAAGSTLATALSTAADVRPTADLLAVTALLAQLSVRSAGDARLAVRVLRAILATDRTESRD